MSLMPNVNPSILRWARETAGLTPEEAVQKLDINDARGVAASDRLVALEFGRRAADEGDACEDGEAISAPASDLLPP